MLSHRSSQRRIGSARSSQGSSWSSSITSKVHSVRSVFLSASNRKKKNDDWRESWVPESALEDVVKKGKKENWVVMGITLLACCGVLGSVTGYLRSRTLVQPTYSGSSTTMSLVQLAKESKYDELHVALRSAIQERCPSAVKALPKEAMFNFQSHMIDIVQHVSDGMSLTHVSDPAVDIHGGVFDRKNEDTKGYDCVIMNELVTLSHGPEHTHEDFKGEFSSGSSDYEKSVGVSLTGHVEYDSKILVSMANKGNFYDLEMTVHKALQMHCSFSGMSERAMFGLHSHVAEVLEKIATHHTTLRGLEFVPAVDIEDGTLVDTTDTMDSHKYQKCSLVTHLFKDALAPMERGVEQLYQFMGTHDFYNSELQMDLLVDYHCPNVQKELGTSLFHDFREHLANFVHYLTEEKAIGNHNWGVSRSGSIVVENSNTISCPVLNALSSHHGDHQHDEADYNHVFNDASQAMKEEEAYLSQHTTSNVNEVKHDVNFLVELVEQGDAAGLEKYVPVLLEHHCPSVVKNAPRYVLRNMHAHLAGTLYWVASGQFTPLSNPRFDEHGEVVGNGAVGSECSLLTEIHSHPTPVKQQPSRKEQPAQTESSPTVEAKTDSYQPEIVTSTKFIEKPLDEQVEVVLKEMSDNDWYDAESHVFDMIEQECTHVIDHFVKVHQSNAADMLLTLHSNVMGFVSVVSQTDELPSGKPVVTDDGHVKFVAHSASEGKQCLVLDAFIAFGSKHLKDAGHKHINVEEELSRQKGHESHKDDMIHDVSLLIEDAKSQQIVDMELDVESDLKTHCPEMMSKLRSRAKRKLHAKVVQIAESVATQRHYPIRDAVVTSDGGIASKNNAEGRTFECSFIKELAARS